MRSRACSGPAPRAMGEWPRDRRRNVSAFRFPAFPLFPKGWPQANSGS
jgi:hypothetical protein